MEERELRGGDCEGNEDVDGGGEGAAAGGAIGMPRKMARANIGGLALRAAEEGGCMRADAGDAGAKATVPSRIDKLVNPSRAAT